MYTTTYQIGVSRRLMNTVYAKQQSEYLCWAASITNILKAYGIYNITQQQFATRICGVKANCPATNYDISRSLNFSGYDQNGYYFEVKAPLGYYKPNLSRLFEEIDLKKPVLVAYQYPNMQMGHAVLITGCEYQIRNGRKYITKLILRDPSPDIINQIYNGRKEITDVTGFLNSIYAHWFVNVYK